MEIGIVSLGMFRSSGCPNVVPVCADNVGIPEFHVHGHGGAGVLSVALRSAGNGISQRDHAGSGISRRGHARSGVFMDGELGGNVVDEVFHDGFDFGGGCAFVSGSGRHGRSSRVSV